MDALTQVESALHSYCAKKIALAASIDARYARLWQEIDRYVMSGGKRMRPRLILLAYEAYGGTNQSAIIPVAAAWELLHASLLVHDDIIDRDLVRHGVPNIAGRYQSLYGDLSTSDVSHYALSAALLGGNLLLVGAYDLASASGLDNDGIARTHAYLHKAVFTVAGGELIDTDAVLYLAEENNPRAVARYKTASYSLQLPLQCGAALAGAPEEELNKLDTIGLHIGIAYQLRDDILGVFGDSAVTGKSNRSDIVEKKRTTLIHETLSRLGRADAARLTQLYTPDYTLDATEAEEVVGLIVASGADKAVEQMIDTEATKAHEVIATLSVSSPYKNALTGIVDTLTHRNN